MYCSKRLASAKAEFKQHRRCNPCGRDDVLKEKCSLCEPGLVRLYSFLFLRPSEFWGSSLNAFQNVNLAPCWNFSKFIPTTFCFRWAYLCIKCTKTSLFGCWFFDIHSLTPMVLRPGSMLRKENLILILGETETQEISKWFLASSFYSCVFWGLDLAFQLCSVE